MYPNGGGTFKDIWDNILRIKNTNNRYFREKISFSAVYSKDLSLIDTFNFFTKNRTINEHKVRFGRVSILDNNYCRKYSFNKNYAQDLEKIATILKRKIKKGEKLENSVEKTFSNLDLIELDRKQYSTLGGTCGFSFKLFIDACGKFHICEKINDKFSIGDVWQGFDFLRMQNILEEFISIFKKYCLQCVFKYLCNPCFIHFAKNGNFDFDPIYCDAQKKNILKKLEEYVELNSLKDQIKIAPDIPTVKKFHQFVMIDKGLVNTAIVDLLRGNVFQVDNETMEKFVNLKYEEVNDFIEIAEKEEIIISVAPGTWIPKLYQNDTLTFEMDQMSGKFFLHLEIEEEVDLNVIKEKFEDFNISQITYFGTEKVVRTFPGVEIKYSKKNFNKCLQLSIVDGNFCKLTEERYYLNKKYNSCWAHKIAITKDGKLRPCIYSSIILGDLMHIDVDNLISKARKYWHLTKDKVEKCKDCELKYVCFDCREIAIRKNGDLYAANPYCQYDPYSGRWSENKNPMQFKRFNTGESA
jgi:radical SAM protein with 4Fe4S-binding SPASM domain